MKLIMLSGHAKEQLFFRGTIEEEIIKIITTSQWQHVNKQLQSIAALPGTILREMFDFEEDRKDLICIILRYKKDCIGASPISHRGGLSINLYGVPRPPVNPEDIAKPEKVRKYQEEEDG